MDDQGLHRIEDDLADGGAEPWVATYLVEIETYLAKHAAFDSFLDAHDT
jgi:hypothetical protein